MASWLQGLDVGNCDIILHVRVCEGLMRQLDGSIEKRFARKELMYPIQVCINFGTSVGQLSSLGLRPHLQENASCLRDADGWIHSLA